VLKGLEWVGYEFSVRFFFIGITKREMIGAFSSKQKNFKG
jgi:hypothetical protein